MITTDAIDRVFRIMHNNQSGSSYVQYFHGKQHLVTAAHIFRGVQNIDFLNIFHDNLWKKIPVQTVFNSGVNGDTIVFRLSQDLGPPSTLETGLENVLAGTWCYFLGFPFEICVSGGAFSQNYPIPFIKAGLLSSVDSSSMHGISKIYLDGHNNKGFSGGPVVWYPPDHGINRTCMPKIIGTISSYIAECPSYKIDGQDYDLISVNSGIINAYWIRNLERYIPKD